MQLASALKRSGKTARLITQTLSSSARTKERTCQLCDLLLSSGQQVFDISEMVLTLNGNRYDPIACLRKQI